MLLRSTGTLRLSAILYLSEGLGEILGVDAGGDFPIFPSTIFLRLGPFDVRKISKKVVDII